MCGDVGWQLAPVRVDLEDGRQRIAHRLSAERLSAGQHLEEHRAEGEDVRAAVGGTAVRLLRRHVGRGAEDDARLGGVDGQRR